jgi:prepilin-type processing-associated H-X9-DG protein
VPITEAGVVAPVDMIAVGDANLMWLLPPVLKLYYGVTGPVSFSGFARLDVSSWNRSMASGFGGSLGILQATQARHGGRFDVGFCDGHVEAVAATKLFDPADNGLRRWNNDNQPHRDKLSSP